MKMKFTIAYKANWGEQLQVDLTYLSRDGYRQNETLPMNTADGYDWVVESQTIANRHHPFTGFVYYYKVVDADGKVIRRESVRSPRAYVYDASKKYLLHDFWLDDEAEKKGEFIDYMKPVGLSKVQVPEMPIFDHTIIFRVCAPSLHEGEAVALLGNYPALGEWNTEHFLPMSQTPEGDWVLSVNIQAMQLPLEYKYVVVPRPVASSAGRCA